MNYWLVKQEPSKYPFSLFCKEKKTIWDGVRNYQARNFLRAMQVGDQVLYYHSVDEKAVVGIAQVLKTSFPDPTSPKGEEWSSVLLGATRAWRTPQHPSPQTPSTSLSSPSVRPPPASAPNRPRIF